jgi:hypothetical protein
MSCETGTSQRGPDPGNTEAQESTTLGAVIRPEPVKTQQTEKTARSVVNCRVCELAIAL